MSLPVRHLPMAQNWDCMGCGNCCREYHISVTAEERQRIESQGWATDAAVAGRPLFVGSGPPWARRYRLNHRADGACVFLSEENRCRLHERHGPAAKPFPCRLYPFVLVPVGDHWRVGLRYACPAAAANKGEPLEHFLPDLKAHTADLERQTGVPASNIPPPPLEGRQNVAWPDLLRFVQALLALLRDRNDRFALRMRKCLALAGLCRKSRFDQITGGRLVEFLNVVSSGLEVTADPALLPPPNRVSRILFRQALAVYARKDQGPERSLVRTRVGLAMAAWRFIRGTGAVPRLHAWIPSTTFESVEKAANRWSPTADEILERYYTVKVSSLQFCGSAHFGFSFWEGFHALALTLPVVLWLTRAMEERPIEEAVIRAIGIVDRNFGFNRVLGLRRQRLALALLCQGDELSRLIGWYSR
jgi:lysine-N-methylase